MNHAAEWTDPTRCIHDGRSGQHPAEDDAGSGAADHAQRVEGVLGLAFCGQAHGALHAYAQTYVCIYTYLCTQIWISSKFVKYQIHGMHNLALRSYHCTCQQVEWDEFLGVLKNCYLLNEASVPDVKKILNCVNGRTCVQLEDFCAWTEARGMSWVIIIYTQHVYCCIYFVHRFVSCFLCDCVLFMCACICLCMHAIAEGMCRGICIWLSWDLWPTYNGLCLYLLTAVQSNIVCCVWPRR